MWGAEHTIMAIVAACFALWFAVRKNWSWLGAAAISQFPFWAGLAAYMFTGDKTPVGVNLALNLVAAGIFIDWGHKLQMQGRGGFIHVQLCKLFVLAGALDILQVVYSFDYYILMQEGVHYLALITIGGRAYVRGLDGIHRNRRNTLDTTQGGGLV